VSFLRKSSKPNSTYGEKSAKGVDIRHNNNNSNFDALNVLPVL
jgi:hypothetical protein